MEPKSGLCVHPSGMDGGRAVQEGRDIGTHLWLIHGATWQKPTQHGKAIILPLDIKKFLSHFKHREKNLPLKFVHSGVRI